MKLETIQMCNQGSGGGKDITGATVGSGLLLEFQPSLLLLSLVAGSKTIKRGTDYLKTKHLQLRLWVVLDAQKLN